MCATGTPRVARLAPAAPSGARPRRRGQDCARTSRRSGARRWQLCAVASADARLRWSRRRARPAGDGAASLDESASRAPRIMKPAGSMPLSPRRSVATQLGRPGHAGVHDQHHVAGEAREWKHVDRAGIRRRCDHHPIGHARSVLYQHVCRPGVEDLRKPITAGSIEQQCDTFSPRAPAPQPLRRSSSPGARRPCPARSGRPAPRRATDGRRRPPRESRCAPCRPATRRG